MALEPLQTSRWETRQDAGSLPSHRYVRVPFMHEYIYVLFLLFAVQRGLTLG